MKPLTDNQSRNLALGLLLLSLLAIGLAIYLPAKLLGQHYDAAIASRSDLLARYQRIIAAAPQIRAALDQVKRSNGRNHMLKNTGAALAASEIQETAKNLIDSTGGKLISMQIAPSKDEGGYQRITVNVQLFSSMTALRQMLYSLETMQPYLLVDNLNVRSQMNSAFRLPPESPQPDMVVGFDLSGYALVVDKK